MSKPVYLIDASIYIFRAYFAIPDEWHTDDGYPVNALYGYTQFLLKFLQTARPDQLAIAYDESLGSCFRNGIYADYKVSRALPDEELAFQLAACKALTERLGITSLASDRYEADDIIATLATNAQQQQKTVAIVTRDKDLGQLLLSPEDYLWDFAADKKMDAQHIVEHFGVRPDQLLDYLSLLGDSVDDIPGVPGIGKKTAQRLIIEMKDKVDVDAITAADPKATPQASQFGKNTEAESALQALGFKPQEASMMVKKVATDDMAVEDIIRTCLQLRGQG